MKNRTSQILYSYWNEVRHGRLAPERFDIEPARIAGILADTMILERIDRQCYRFRLAGSRIVDHMCGELRGANFLDLWPAEEHNALISVIERIASEGGVGVFEMEGEAIDGRVASFEAVVMPLVHTRGAVDRFLGAISPIKTHSWLGSQPFARLHLVESHIVWPDGRPHTLVQGSQPPVFVHSGLAGRIVRHERRQFRVLDGGLMPEKGPKL